MNEKCECQVSYQEFKSGYTFREIRENLKVEARRKHEINGEYMFITGHTVLGRWRELKLQLWDRFQEDIRVHGCTCQGKNG